MLRRAGCRRRRTPRRRSAPTRIRRRRRSRLLHRSQYPPATPAGRAPVKAWLAEAGCVRLNAMASVKSLPDSHTCAQVSADRARGAPALGAGPELHQDRDRPRHQRQDSHENPLLVGFGPRACLERGDGCRPHERGLRPAESPGNHSRRLARDFRERAAPVLVAQYLSRQSVSGQNRWRPRRPET